MKVSDILNQIDNGAIALPVFQRGYVWNRDQVKGLMEALYHRHPVGSLLTWVTRTENVNSRGDSPLQPGYVKLLLDGQQRITTLYGIIRARSPHSSKETSIPSPAFISTWKRKGSSSTLPF